MNTATLLKLLLGVAACALLLAFPILAANDASEDIKVSEGLASDPSTPMGVLRSMFVTEDDKPRIFSIGATLLVAILIVRQLMAAPTPSNLPPDSDGVTIPWFGDIVSFGKNPPEFILRNYYKHGDIFGMQMFGRKVYYMTGPEAIRSLVEADEEVLAAREAYQFTVPVFGKGVVYDCPHEMFMQQRKFAGMGLGLKMLKVYVPKIVEEVMSYMDEHWGDEGEIELLNTFNEITILTATRCLHGDEIRSRVHVGFAQLMDELDGAFTPVAFFFPNLPLPAFRKRDIARQRLAKMYDTILEARRKENRRGDDMMQVFMDSQYEDGTKLTNHEVCSLLVALMMAGQHTSNVTSTWLALHIASDPVLRERIQKEVDATSVEELDYDAVRKMETMNNAVKEVLRMHPPIMAVFRKVLKDFKYKDYTVPEGSLVAFSPSAIHMRSEIYPNPEKFDVDRFVRGEDKKEPFAFIPFSAGRHACIGEQFAYLQVKTILATILAKYDLEIVGSLEDYPPCHDRMIVNPKPPVRARYRRRK